MKARLPSRCALLLVCLGLGAFVSPAAAQGVFDGFPFKGAVFAQGTIIMHSGNLTDSYNSDLGPYDPATAGSNGDVGSNGSISLANSAVVKGDATAVGTVTGGTVTGTRTQNAAPFPTPPTPPCPTGGYTPAAYIPSGPGITYSAATGALTVNGNLTLTAPPTRYYFSSVTIKSGGTLTINGGGQVVQVWVDGLLNLAGDATFNTSLRAPLVGFRVQHHDLGHQQRERRLLLGVRAAASAQVQ